MHSYKVRYASLSVRLSPPRRVPKRLQKRSEKGPSLADSESAIYRGPPGPRVNLQENSKEWWDLRQNNSPIRLCLRGPYFFSAKRSVGGGRYCPQIFKSRARFRKVPQSSTAGILNKTFFSFPETRCLIHNFFRLPETRF